MTALYLVNQWQREGRISPHLYELLVRRLTVPPFSPYTLSIVGISAEQLNEIVTSGKIARVKGIGDRRLAELRRLVRPHHLALYIDVEQLMRYDQKREAILAYHREFTP